MDNLVSIMIIFAQRMCRHLSNNGKSRDTGTNLSPNLMTRLMLKIKNGFSGERSLVLPKMVTDMMKADPIASILYVTDIGYYPKAENHYRERKEPIGQYVFIYCIDGFGSYDVDGKHYEVSPNQYFILPAGKPHTYQADTAQPWTIYWIHFSGSLAEHYAADTMAPISVNPGLHSRISNRINMFEELFDALNSGYSIENIRYSMSLFHHYLSSLRYVRQYREAGGQPDGNDVVDAAIHFMKENLERHITLQEVADFTGYSPSFFSRLFKTKTGHSPLNYINLLKIKRACLMLDTTHMKVNQICHKLGMDDPYYFSRLFSKIMGMSPRSYRSRPKT